MKLITLAGAEHSDGEVLDFLAAWTQQLLVELQFIRSAGTFIGVPTEVTLAVNAGLLRAGRTPIFIGQVDQLVMIEFRREVEKRAAEWWQLH